MDCDETPEYTIRNKNSTRKRLQNRNEIRNLNVRFAKRDGKNAINQTRHNETNGTSWFLKLLLIAVCLAGFILYKSNLCQDLQNHYNAAYERLSKDLCSKRRANFTPILEAINRNVVGQRHIPDEVNSWFQAVGNGGSFSSALFVGGTGVGKTFTANLIVRHYPYPRNVVIIPIKQMSDKMKPYTAFKMALFKIQRETMMHGICNHYLIVLDHLSSTDMPLLKKISDRLRTLGTTHLLAFHALFVFQGTAQAIEQDTVKEMIPEARLIKFASLGPNELELCIRREASAIGIDLSEKEYIVPMVVKQINVSRHGCKPVRAKISLHSV